MAKPPVIMRPGGYRSWEDETPIRKPRLAPVIWMGLSLFVCSGLVCFGLGAMLTSTTRPAATPTAQPVANYTHRDAGRDLGLIAGLGARLARADQVLVSDVTSRARNTPSPAATIDVTPATPIPTSSPTPTANRDTPTPVPTTIPQVVTVVVTAPPREIIVTIPPIVYVTELPPTIIVVTPTPHGLRGSN